MAGSKFADWEGFGTLTEGHFGLQDHGDVVRFRNLKARVARGGRRMNQYQGFDYDVIVVGSGAGGGMAAHTLTGNGVRVLMLEAGRDYDPVTETPMFNTYDQAPLRGTRSPDKHFGFYDATVDGGWQVPGEPYTTGRRFGVSLVAGTHARGQDQPLGPSVSAFQPSRFQSGQPGRLRRRLAHGIRRSGALV